jgi:hypothetical protein
MGFMPRRDLVALGLFFGPLEREFLDGVEHEGPRMTPIIAGPATDAVDIAMAGIVIGVIVLALTVDVAAAIGWLRSHRR